MNVLLKDRGGSPNDVYPQSACGKTKGLTAGIRKEKESNRRAAKPSGPKFDNQ